MLSADTRLLIALGAISLAMALCVLESYVLGIHRFEAAAVFALGALSCVTVFFCIKPLPLALLWLLVLFYEEIVNVVFQHYPALGSLGPVYVLPMDIPYLFTLTYLLVTSVMRPREIGRVFNDYPFLVLFIITVIGSIVIYTPDYGKEAIGEARKYFFFFFFPVLAVTSTTTFPNLHRLLSGVFLLAVGVSALGYLRLFMDPSVLTSDLRPISANGALILLFATFSVLITRANKMVITNKNFDNAMVGLFVPMIIIPHHRTVFLAATLGLFLLLGLHRRKVLFALRAIVASVIIGAAIGVAFMASPRFENILTKAVGGLSDPSSDETGSWRLEAWSEQLSQLSGSERLVGKGLGSYYRWYRMEGGMVREINVNPHSAYVQIILKFGLLGLVLYLLLAFSFFRRMLLVRRKLPPGPVRAYIEMGLVNFGAAHAFLIGYQVNLIILVWYAIGITAVRLLQDGRQISAEREAMIRENWHGYFASQSA
jgi:hypothetical protein